MAVHLNNVDSIPHRAMRYDIEQEDDHVSKGLNLVTLTDLCVTLPCFNYFGYY